MRCDNSNDDDNKLSFRWFHSFSFEIWLINETEARRSARAVKLPGKLTSCTVARSFHLSSYLIFLGYLMNSLRDSRREMNMKESERDRKQRPENRLLGYGEKRIPKLDTSSECMVITHEQNKLCCLGANSTKFYTTFITTMTKRASFHRGETV